MTQTSNHQKNITQCGSALLTVLVLLATTLIVTATSVALMFINSAGTTRLSLAEEALAVAEAGAENAVLRVIRDDSYTGETVSIGNGAAIISVSGTSPKTIVSEGRVGSIYRRVQVTGSYTGTVFSVSSWSEVP